MKRIVFLSLVGVLLLASLSFAAETPELRGTWKGEVLVHTASGLKKAQSAIVINEQEGRQFRGYKLWFNQKKVLQREMVVGIYDANGRLYFAEKNDGYAFGDMTGKESMTINYLEGGAEAKTLIYHLERVHFTTGFVEIDKDGNKAIMKAEITTHYPLNAERIIKEADSDKDGKLTQKEWMSWKKANAWQ